VLYNFFKKIKDEKKYNSRVLKKQIKASVLLEFLLVLILIISVSGPIIKIVTKSFNETILLNKKLIRRNLILDCFQIIKPQVLINITHNTGTDISRFTAFTDGQVNNFIKNFDIKVLVTEYGKSVLSKETGIKNKTCIDIRNFIIKEKSQKDNLTNKDILDEQCFFGTYENVEDLQEKIPSAIFFILSSTEKLYLAVYLSEIIPYIVEKK